MILLARATDEKTWHSQFNRFTRRFAQYNWSMQIKKMNETLIIRPED